MARRYQKIKELLPKIEEMLEAGKTQREVENHFGLTGKRTIHELLKRERRKKRQKTIPARRGQPSSLAPRTKQQYEKRIERLERDNELLRSFLHAAGRM